MFRQFPLDFHLDATQAHHAALAAKDQGKFWGMHDKIFANQRSIKRDDLLRFARELNLDIPKFTADMDSGKYKSIIEADIAEGKKLGVTGTPTFFINSRMVVGAKPQAELEKIIQEEWEKLNPGKKLEIKKPYSGTNLLTSSTPPAVALEVFADVRSTLSAQTEKLVKEIGQSYPKNVQPLYRNLPLSIHPDSPLAHEALMAAADKGHFWQMHDLVLNAPSPLTEPALVDLGVRAGMDRAWLRSALTNHTYKAKVDTDLAEAARRRVTGAPTFFINGKRIDGIQPLAVFRDYIEAELAQAKTQAALAAQPKLPSPAVAQSAGYKPGTLQPVVTR